MAKKKEPTMVKRIKEILERQPLKTLKISIFYDKERM